MILGITSNPYSMNVPKNLIEGAKKLSIKTRIIDLPSLRMVLDGKNGAIVMDKDGIVEVDAIAPYLLYGFPVAVNAFRILTRSTFSQNSLESVLIADDKAATAEKLSCADIPQVKTILCGNHFDTISSEAGKLGYPVVLKRSHGAQGYWVRRAKDAHSLRVVFDELMQEGPGTLILQPQIIESEGKSIRVVTTGGKVLAITQREAKKGEWRSNIAGGATQYHIELSETETKVALAATKEIGLQHAGIDLLRTSQGTVVLEVNSCPDFTSMIPYYEQDLTELVLKASLPQ